MYSNYEVIRLIQQDSNYHIISDYVTGKALGIHIIQQPNMEKEQFFVWIMQILTQLDYITSSSGVLQDGNELQDTNDNEATDVKKTHCWKCITPFHVILKSDNTVALLNMEAKVNRKFLNQIAEHSIIKKFQLGEESGNLFYSFGKTLQFLLAKSNLSPNLTYGEERKLQKIISKCLTENHKKQYRSFANILLDFPTNYRKQNQSNPQRRNSKRFIRLIGILALVFSCGLSLYFWSMGNINNEAYFELGLSYFVMEDYEKSFEMFGKARYSGTFEDYREMASYMYGASEYTEMEMETMLRKLMKNKEKLSQEEKSCLIRVCNKLDTSYARSQVIKMGNVIVKNSSWNENINEIREILASVYQREGQYEEALEQYEELLKNQYGEELYKTVIELYQKCGKHEEALQLCVDGIFHNEKSISLGVSYISLVCQDKTITKEKKEEKIESLIERHVEILEEQRFKSLQVQYGIKVEGGSVWLEN
ncbi:MAG: tetratricopeptide repeat protein [Clostridia bacterium]|nr:tetratricopeptide repeat protein [Clostridia bacterium]